VAFAKTVTLVDPLMTHYLRNVQGCTYRSGKLLGEHATLLVQAGGEDLDFHESFDTVGRLSGLLSIPSDLLARACLGCDDERSRALLEFNPCVAKYAQRAYARGAACFFGEVGRWLFC
jgi:hypothetical protein